jgi:hypothetical protein
VPVVSPLIEVRGVLSTWRALLSSRLLQPVWLMARGGRALPQWHLGAIGYARYVCYGRLPSHISRRRVGSFGLVATRFLHRADDA